MDKFKVAVEGAEYVVQAPDEQTAWDWANQTHRAEQAKKPVKFTHTATPAEAIAGNPVTRAFVGAAEFPLAIGQAINKGLSAVGAPPWMRTELGQAAEAYRPMAETGRREAAQGDPGIDVARIAGNVVNPVGLAAAKALPVATTLGQKVAQGGQLGGLFGLGSLVDNPEEGYLGQKAIQMAGGAAAGAAIPAITTGLAKGATGVSQFLRSFLPGGLEKGVGREIIHVAGKDLPQAKTALQEAREMVPGAKPTGGEAVAEIGNAELAGMAGAARKANPTPFEKRRIAQDLAHKKHAEIVARTPQDLERATTERTASANAAFGAIRNEILPDVGGWAELLKNPLIKEALPKAVRSAEASKRSFPTKLDVFRQRPPITVGNVSDLKGVLSARLSTAVKNDDKLEAKLLTEAIKDLDNWASKQNPKYAEAVADYAARSGPIEQMKAGQAFTRIIAPPETEYGQFPNITSVAPAKFLKDADPKVLDPSTLGTLGHLGDVAGSIGRRDRFNELARLGGAENLEGLATRDIVRRTGAEPTIGLLDRTAMILNAISRRASGMASEKMKEKAAEAWLNPQDVLRLIELAETPAQRTAIINALMNNKVTQGTRNFMGRVPYVPGISTGLISQNLE